MDFEGIFLLDSKITVKWVGALIAEVSMFVII